MNHDVVMEALASDPITDFAIQLLATGVGAALGFLAAMLVSSLNNKDNTKVRKKNTIKAIHEELKSLEKGVEELKDTTHIKWNQDKLEFEGGWLSVSTPAFHSSVNSGDFSLLDTKLQTEIGDVYLSIDELKIFTQQRLQFPFSIVMQSSESKKEGDRIVENTNHVMDKLNAQLTPLLLKLKK